MSEPRHENTIPPSPFLLHPSSLHRLARLIRKEVLSILRDRRTIITLVLMPLLLYPLLTIAFQQFLLGQVPPGDQTTYVVGFRSKEERDAVAQFIGLGLESIIGRRSPPPLGQHANQPLPELKTPDE